jgi:hypothetical protein
MTMSCITYSQIQATMEKLPGGKVEPPLKFTGQQSLKDPPDDRQSSKKPQKLTQAQQLETVSEESGAKSHR